MDKYLLDLIERMSTKQEHNTSSSDSISFRAHREAESLENIEYINQLVEYIHNHEKKEFKDKRRSAYFILAKLLTRYEDIRALDFFIGRVLLETDKYMISSILDSLENINKPVCVSIDPIVFCLSSEKWLIRHSAICALKKSEHPLARETILSRLNDWKNDIKKHSYELTYAHSVLSDIGLLDDIVVLEGLLDCRIRDVKVSAEYAINSIKNRCIINHELNL